MSLNFGSTNQAVGGSNPSGRAISKTRLNRPGFFVLHPSDFRPSPEASGVRRAENQVSEIIFARK
jgi:hypothetical protein